MKPSPIFAGALPRYILAALLLPSLPLLGQALTNGSFEANNFTTAPGYVSGNTAITGWTGSPTNRVGLNPAPTASPFADNAQIPNGTKVAFIQAGASGPAFLQTTVTGLVAGTKYHVSLRANARSNTTSTTLTAGNYPFLVFSTDTSEPAVGAEIQRVQPTAQTPLLPYRYLGYDFVATGTEQILTLTNNKAAGDHTVVIDDVTIAPSTGAWSTTLNWDDDATSGIDSSYAYTHAYNFNGASLNINDVPFLGTNVAVPGRFTMTGLINALTIPAVDNKVTGNSGIMAGSFRFDGDPSITLQNLKPNTQYVFSVYGVGFDTATAGVFSNRSATFSSSLGGERYTVNLNQRAAVAPAGRGKGMIVNYTYTTDALATPVTISYPRLSTVAGSFHTSGFSNREAVASVPAQWTVSQWTDDETSGISPNHLYTHAFKFGAAENFNVNGIDFIGIAGANPVGFDYSSAGLPGVFNNDVNAVTGYGSPLAKDFLWNGFPSTHTLTGLTPGKSYVFTLYSVGWNDGLREGVFSAPNGGALTVLNQDQFGDNQGVRFETQYTADSTGTATISLYGRTDTPALKSIHNYGISNREADPYVDKEPEITFHPQGGIVGVGADFTLRVGAIGSETLSYQWKKGVTNIPDATGPTLQLFDVTSLDAGTYSVVVTNDDGSVTSDTAELIVQEVVPGHLNTGMGLDGQLLAAGQIDPSFKLIVNPDAPGIQDAFIQSGNPGAWLPNSATAKWIGPRENTTNAAGAPTSDGAEAPGVYVYRTTLDLTGFDLDTVEISGRWSSDNNGVGIRVNGTSVGFPNTTNTFATLVPFNINNLAFPGLLTTGTNTIDFVVENLTIGYTGLLIENFAAIGFIPPGTSPYIAIQPAPVTGVHNSFAVLAVGASGSSPFTYQWYKGTNPISGETSSFLAVPIDDLTAAGSYKVRVTNGSGFLDSNPAVVTVTNTAPVVTGDSLATEPDVALDITPQFDLIPNDTDVDGDLLFLESFSAASAEGGTLTLDEDLLIYTPPAGFVGFDTFTYTVNDGVWGGVSLSGTVSVMVGNPAVDPPVSFALTLVGGDIVASFTGTPGGEYTLQRSTNLTAWDDIATQTASPAGLVEITDPEPPVDKAFYRISYLAAP